MNPGTKLWQKAKTIIPGGGQLLSKRAEMFYPGGWPAYYQKAKGVKVWALDGKQYLDMSIMGIGTCVLGYADSRVNAAVKKAIDRGSMNTLNCPEEVMLAQELIKLHPWAQMARFARTGGEACAVAVRIARAASGKDTVLFCGYHGWSDWYIASNVASGSNLNDQLLPGLKARGVPASLKGTAVPFHYGNLKEFKQKLAERRGKVGVVIMEVQRYKDVDVNFLREVKRLAHKAGAVLIFDEITSGFRLCAGGVHTLYGVEPDMVVLGKALGNGFPVSAIIGKKEIMEAAQETFISSTYWTERIGFTAALEVIRQFKTEPVAKHLSTLGHHFKREYERLLRSHGLNASLVGMAPAPHVELVEKDSALLETVYTQEMLKKGFLASNLTYFSYAHTKKIVDQYLSASDEVWGFIVRARKAGNLKKYLVGEVRHTGFKRLT